MVTVMSKSVPATTRIVFAAEYALGAEALTTSSVMEIAIVRGWGEVVRIRETPRRSAPR